ncbi:hypothetical protein BY996DRAFT_8433573 [Phakopsora pachyrhizi]|nr:hypothetical protein BY996DRAFT_8433573 [Phakopsora pachyrhizi]
MPSIQPRGNGFIASWVCRELLEQGFRVKGTVRDKEKGDYLSRLFEGFGDRFSYIVVENILEQEAFDEAIEGVEGAVHIASPIHTSVGDPYDDFINPALDGTLSVLNSAKKRQGFKRFVLMSSYGAVYSPKEDPTYVFTEEDWNEFALELFKKLGKETPLEIIYCASKVLAEKSAWKFIENEKPVFDLVALCPPLVWGPIIHEVKDANHLNATLKFLYDYLSTDVGMPQGVANIGHLVDVRDVAKLTIECFLREKAGGNRYIVGKENVYDDEFNRKNWPKASKNIQDELVLLRHNPCDSSKSEKDLGITYRPLGTIIKDASVSLKEHSKAWEKNSPETKQKLFNAT